MGAPRKNPPKDAAADIERLAGKGHSTVGVGKFFNVARTTVMRWFEDEPGLEEAYERGRDSYRQELEEKIIALTIAGKQCAGLIYLMKAKFKFYDVPSSNTQVDVAVAVATPVLVVRSHGSDEEWAAKAAEQQRRLMQDTAPRMLEAPESPLQGFETAAAMNGMPAPVVTAPAAFCEAPVWKRGT